jgi:hypothetical protein
MARSLGVALLLLAVATTTAPAATLEPVGGTFEQPIFVTSDPEDPDRLLVVEQPGRVAEVLDDGPPTLFADLTGLVLCCGERGLLSIAPAPDFHESGLFYAAYTGKTAAGGEEGDIHVDAFTADESGRVTRMPIISVPHSQAGNHNGGQLQFGPDGYLYVSTGDGGGGGDPFESGQDLNSLLGKVLRIAPHPGATPAYSIPPGNPFAGPTAGADEIWAYGLRNPWRFSFDALTDDLLIADVGQGAREEVNFATSPVPGVVGGAGANYGWSCREGLLPYTDSTPSANCAGAGGFTDPVFDYPHSDPDPPADRAYGCSITGGYVVRDPSLGDLYGRYVYADYCVGEVRSLELPAGTQPARGDRAEPLGRPTPNPTSFGEDSCNRLYIASGSSVFRLVGDSPADCTRSSEVEPPAEEEPPGGVQPPLIPVAPDTQTPNPFSFTSPSPPSPAPPTVSLAADDLGGGNLRFFVTVNSCSRSEADSIQLNRGGRRIKRKPLNGVCGARFRVHLERHASFRALYRPTPGAAAIRSNRLAF